MHDTGNYEVVCGASEERVITKRSIDIHARRGQGGVRCRDRS